MKIHIEIEDNKVRRWAYGGFEILSGVYLVIGARAIGTTAIGIAMMLLGIVNIVSGLIVTFSVPSSKLGKK